MSGRLRIALAPGDGIGPEIMEATLTLFRAAGVLDQVEFAPVEMGASVFEKGNTRGMTDEAVRTVEECGILFKGPMETPKGRGGKSINVTARKLWNAYANYRVFKTLPGVETVYSKAGIPIDLAIVRENIEDTYGGIETRLSADVVECKRLISATGSDEVHRFAFETAKKLGLTKVHCAHKANIMKLTDGLFLERFKAVGAKYAPIEIADVIVDALCMNLSVKPQQYRMIVLPNLQGDIVSDLAAGLVGGLGFAPSANIGNHVSIFEAVHGTAPDIAGKGIANPTSLVLSGLMMLRHLCLVRQAAQIENALLATLESGVHTGDFGDRGTPSVGTKDFTQAIIERLGQTPQTVPPVPPSDEAECRFARPKRPAHPPVIATFRGMASEVAGVDIYTDAPLAPPALAAEMRKLAEGTPFKVTVVTNRGTQVWPTGSVFTELVDLACVRFEGAGDQRAAMALATRVAEKVPVSEVQMLRVYGGVKGYGLAQGQ